MVESYFDLLISTIAITLRQVKLVLNERGGKLKKIDIVTFVANNNELVENWSPKEALYITSNNR